MKFSIIVISHNQKEQLRRCINSLLTQELPFEHEIIISDDASDDGTWELAKEFSALHPTIKAVRCNTSDFGPANNSERSGWNRCNGYQYATGEFIAHVDADDFHVSGKDVYKRQIKMLESHPNCSCCMANDYSLNDGDDLGKAELRHNEVFETGEILSSYLYVKKYFRESHCFVYRRIIEVNPVELYGGFYVDTLITAHYIQFGDIVCLDDASYVYVQYKNSIWATNKHAVDRFVLAPPIYIPFLISTWRGVYTQGRGPLRKVLKAIKLSLSGYKLKESSYKWIEKYNMYFYNTFLRKMFIPDYIRLVITYCYVLILIVWNPMYKWPHKLLCKLLY